MNCFIIKETVSRGRALNMAQSIISSDVYQPFSDRDALAQCIRDVTGVNFDLSPIGRRRLTGFGATIKQALGRDYAVIGGENRSLLTRAKRSVIMGMEIDPIDPNIVRLAPVATLIKNYRHAALLLKVWNNRED